MKKFNLKSMVLLLVSIVSLSLGASGCMQQPQDEAIAYEVSENAELGCVELHREGIVYRPFGVFYDTSFRGALLGIREGDAESKICEVKNYASTEWIAEYVDGFMGGGDMLYKAVGVTNIPEELESFQQYDY